MPVRFDIPSSGLTASAQALAVSAHSTANLATEGFGRQRLSAFEGPRGGVGVRVDRVELSSRAVAAARALPGPDNNVQAAMEAVARISARHAFASGARALRAMDRGLQALLDTMA